jgi:hypothetical protein
LPVPSSSAQSDDYIPRAHDESGSCGKIAFVMTAMFLNDPPDGAADRVPKADLQAHPDRNYTKGHKRTERDTKGQHFRAFFFCIHPDLTTRSQPI